MKTIKYILTFVFALIFMVGCKEDYIDPISKVEPGEDKEVPQIVINNPTDDVIIPFTDTQTTLDIKFEVTDDIEIKSVTLLLNNEELANYTSFKDYRKFVKSFLYENLAVGQHSIEVKAVDMEGNEVSKEITFNVNNKYSPKYDGEVFYMPFEGNLYRELISEINALTVGEPAFNEGKFGKAYAGAADSYIISSAENIKNEEISVVFWYYLKTFDEDPEYGQRAGILSIGTGNENRLQGFRLFREGDQLRQRIKLNVGTGNGESWNDGDEIVVADGQWVHIAVTISKNKNTIYFNGEEVRTADMAEGIDWTNCENLTIGAGGETFSYWNHLSDISLIDELRIFNKVLTKEQINSMLN